MDAKEKGETVHTPDPRQESFWWKEGVIYQIYPRSFQDGNRDGVGDLEGIVQRLDYLNGQGARSLGVDAIWLSPIHPSPMADFGYDISDYCDIDPVFGNLETFDRLVREAHRRGIRIILDMVFNHTSDRHPWFLDSRSGRNSRCRDWYLWKDPKPGGGPPNNWQAAFGGSGWERDELTGQYYYHSFLKEQPDVNWRNPELRRAVYDTMRFWLDRGVDGFRLDVVHFYGKDSRFRDNPRGMTGMTRGLISYDRYRHVYDRDQPEIHEIFREMRQVTDGYPERMMVGETPYEYGADVAASYLGNGEDELHLAFYFKFLWARWNARAYRDRIEKLYRALPERGWPCWVLNNHDMPRSVDRHACPFEPLETRHARARAAALILLTLRGTPFLYYGEELGMRNGKIPRKAIQDPLGKRYWPVYRGRDMSRTPMQWDRLPFGGFSTSEPWLPLNPDWPVVNVENQQALDDSLFCHYRHLLRLRRGSAALRAGSFHWTDGLPETCLGYRRELGKECFQILVNFSSSPVRFPAPWNRETSWGPVASSLPGPLRSPEDAAGRVTLRSREGLVLQQAERG
jgi:alpha-glucosidase